MPSAKRERKRAGREVRLAAVRAARQRKRRRRQGVLGVVAVAAALLVIYLITRGGAAKTAAVASTASCSPGPKPATRSFAAAPPQTVSASKSYVAVVCTSDGTFEIQLAAAQAPRTVNDFVFLARQHFYDGLPFHRVVPGFVVQGGDPHPPTATSPSVSGAQGPGYTVQGELPRSGHYPLWSVAMAKAGSQHNGASGSQFFIVVGPSGEALPADYALLGKVTSGFTVIRKIEKTGNAQGTPPAHPAVVKNVTVVAS